MIFGESSSWSWIFSTENIIFSKSIEILTRWTTLWIFFCWILSIRMNRQVLNKFSKGLFDWVLTKTSLTKDTKVTLAKCFESLLFETLEVFNSGSCWRNEFTLRLCLGFITWDSRPWVAYYTQVQIKIMWSTLVKILGPLRKNFVTLDKMCSTR